MFTMPAAPLPVGKAAWSQYVALFTGYRTYSQRIFLLFEDSCTLSAPSILLI
jgi:hypothetical protein